MAGQIVIGDLVASRATGKSSAIVAMPVLGEVDVIVGAQDSTMYLDSLSPRLKRELDLQPREILFSIDATPLGALQDDPEQRSRASRLHNASSASRRIVPRLIEG